MKGFPVKRTEMCSMPMVGKRVLVTGAGTGIGKGIALEFGRQRAVVAVYYSQSVPGADTVVKAMVDHGGMAAAFPADFREVEPSREMARRAGAFLGGLDVLVNNTGIHRDIAHVAVLLASDEARYIAGQTLVVNGGTTSWMPFGEQFKQPVTVEFGLGYVPGP